MQSQPGSLEVLRITSYLLVVVCVVTVALSRLRSENPYPYSRRTRLPRCPAWMLYSVEEICLCILPCIEHSDLGGSLASMQENKSSTVCASENKQDRCTMYNVLMDKRKDKRVDKRMDGDDLIRVLAVPRRLHHHVPLYALVVY